MDGRLKLRNDRQELRDVAAAIRQVAALMADMPPEQREDTAKTLCRRLEARLDALTEEPAFS